MEPVSTLGKFGRTFFLILGILILIIGIIITVHQHDTRKTAPCVATITAFSTKSESPDSEPQVSTLVSYTFNGKEYQNIALAQIEANWEIGDQITVYCSYDNPTDIKTGTMSYGGWLVILLSVPFITISFYMLMTMNRSDQKRTAEEIADDEEQTKNGKLKYKTSSIIIPLSAGIPVTLMGLIFLFLEHQSALAWIALILGCSASAAGIRSFILYLKIKYTSQK